MAGNLEINFILSPEVVFKILSNKHRSASVDRCYRARTGSGVLCWTDVILLIWGGYGEIPGEAGMAGGYLEALGP